MIKMIRSASIALIAALLATTTTSFAADEMYNRPLVLSRANFLCDWAPEHINVASNPLAFCDSVPVWTAEGFGYEKIDAAVALWWAGLIRKNPKRSARYLGQFEDAFAAYQRELVNEEEELRSPVAQAARAQRGIEIAKTAPSMSPLDLCSSFSAYHLDAFREELERRHVLSSDEWDLVEHERVKVGMSELAMICSWGKPKRVNRKIDAVPDHKRHFYGDYRFVYTENGKVTGFH